MAVTGIARISLTTADCGRSAEFYERALGFVTAGEEQHGGEAFSTLMGLPGATAEARVMRVGRQAIELLRFAAPGRPYPGPAASNDLFFQHFAIVVADMRAAYERLCGCPGWTEITRHGPQRLPASSGGVSAFKFRDPEGHPLELLAFPPGRVPAPWDGAAAGGGTCLGIDHTAIVVAHTADSVAFYGALGFAAAGGTLNHGPEQERLDNLPGAVAEVTALALPRPTPHLELLCYRRPASPAMPPSPPRNNDIAATRLVLAAGDDPGHSHGGLVVAKESSNADDGRMAALVRDPTGHALLISSQA